jgi:hypothetical protein
MDMDLPRLEQAGRKAPDKNCPVCPLVATRNEDLLAFQYLDDGFRWHGQTFHIGDFVFTRSGKEVGPCNIGRVIEVLRGSKGRKNKPTIVLMHFGRLSELVPENVAKEEVSLIYRCEWPG